MNQKTSFYHSVYIYGDKLQVKFYSNGAYCSETLDKRIYSFKDSAGEIIFNLKKIESRIKGLSL